MIARDYFGQLTAPYLILLGFAWVLFVGSLDYVTGKEINLAIFYLFPVAFITWFMRKWDGFCVSAVAVLAWGAVESTMDSYSQPDLLYWNAAVRLLFFSIVVGLVSTMKLAFDDNARVILRAQIALAKINTLKAPAPVCAWCQKVRDSQGHWQQFEAYFKDHAVVDVTHGICPDCLTRLEKDLA